MTDTNPHHGSEEQNNATGSHAASNTHHLLPASILLGSIIIAGSIFYNTGLLLKSLNGTQLPGSNQVNAGAQQGDDPNQRFTVPERRDAPVLGNSNAKVTIVEFSDFQCPFCQRFFQQAYPEIKSKYLDTGKAKLVFRHYPLTAIHPFAQKAGEAAECAGRQNKFFEYHDTLFAKMKSDGTGLAIADLKQYARDLGLDTGRFNSCLDNGETAEIVKKDLEDGGKVGVSGTPTVFINGKRIVGAQPFANFEQAIEEALK